MTWVTGKIQHVSLKKISRQALFLRLKQIRDNCGDTETAHIQADRALLAFIDDPEITLAYNAVERWYA